MKKSFFKYIFKAIALVTLCVIVFGAISFFNTRKFYQSRSVVLQDCTKKRIGMSLNGDWANDRKYCTLHLQTDSNEMFYCFLWLEKVKFDDLATSITLEISVNGQLLESKKLKEYLSGEQVTFNADFKKQSENTVELVFIMNDVTIPQDAHTDFDIVLFSKK